MDNDKSNNAVKILVEYLTMKNVAIPKRDNVKAIIAISLLENEYRSKSSRQSALSINVDDPVFTAAQEVLLMETREAPRKKRKDSKVRRPKRKPKWVALDTKENEIVKATSLRKINKLLNDWLKENNYRTYCRSQFTKLVKDNDGIFAWGKVSKLVSKTKEPV